MDYPLYILVINDDQQKSVICRRTAPSTNAPEGSYVPYATGSRPEMRQLFRDLTTNTEKDPA